MGEGKEGVRTFRNLPLVHRGNCEGGGTGGGSSCLKHKAGSAHSHPQMQMVKINTSQLLGCLEWVAKGKGRESTGGSKFSARFRLEAPLKERKKTERAQVSGHPE